MRLASLPSVLGQVYVLDTEMVCVHYWLFVCVHYWLFVCVCALLAVYKTYTCRIVLIPSLIVS